MTASHNTSLVLSARLTVISHKHHLRLPDGQLSVYGGFARLKSVFAQHVDQLNLCVPVGQGTDFSAAIEYPSNILIRPMPLYEDRRDFIRNLPNIVIILWREIGKADLVYTMCPNDMGLLGLTIARLRRKPFFMSLDTDRAERARLEKGWRGSIKSWLIKRTVYSLIRCLGRGYPTYVTGNLFLGVSPNWKQWIKTTITSDELPAFRKPNPSQPRPLRVIFVGRLSREKNIECLIEATALRAEGGGDIEVKIVGQGPRLSVLKDQVAKQAPQSVTFTGPVPNTELRRTRFLEADVLVLPSKEERQGKVLLEAMACSVPVIAANAGGIPSVIEHNTNGLLFDPDTPAELAECLKRIAEDHVLRGRLILNGYRLAEANTLDRSISEIMKDVATFYGIQAH